MTDELLMSLYIFVLAGFLGHHVISRSRTSSTRRSWPAPTRSPASRWSARSSPPVGTQQGEHHPRLHRRHLRDASTPSADS